MKLMVALNIDVSKIDKTRIFVGEKGKYLSTVLQLEVDESAVDQYGNSGMLLHSLNKEERDAGVKLPVLANAKIIGRYGSQPAATPPQQLPKEAPPEDLDDDIPF